jgi:hypothetical protein
MAWFDEPAELLAGCVRSLKVADVDVLVALDGAYGLYPDGQAQSPPGQVEAIRSAGVECQVHVPGVLWETEMAKRTALFRHVDEIAEPGDWLLVIDADEAVIEADGLKDRLEATDLDAAEVALLDGPPTNCARAWVEGGPMDTFRQGRKVRPTRRLFRWEPGIRVVENHFTYVTRDGGHLWGLHPVEALNAFDVVLDHRSYLRPALRHEAAQTYYDRRNVAQVEKHISKLPRPMGIVENERLECR